MADSQIKFSYSLESASVFVNAIHGATESQVTAHLDQLARVHHDPSGRLEASVQSVLTSVLECMPSPVCLTIRRAIGFPGLWLVTVLPLTCHQFDLSSQEFRDVLFAALS